MKLFIDTGHPAHIHFFNPIIKKMIKDEHEYLLCIREKDCSVQIAQSYHLNYTSKGKGSYSILLKPFYLIRSVFQIYFLAKKFKPNLFLSFASPYAGIVSWLLNRPHLVFDDTEPDPLLQAIYKTFSTQIITPTCFQKDFGKKHIQVNSYKELAYLGSQYVIKNPDFKEQLGFRHNQDYILVRLVNHGNMHDIFVNKWNSDSKIHFIKTLAEKFPIVISSEITLPQNLEKYRLKLPEKRFHETIANAKLIVCESATVATESAILGIPALFIDYNTRGYVDEIERNYDLIKSLKPTRDGLKEANDFIYQIMSNPINKEYQSNRQKLLSEKEDIVEFIVQQIYQTTQHN